MKVRRSRRAGAGARTSRVSVFCACMELTMTRSAPEEVFVAQLFEGEIEQAEMVHVGGQSAATVMRPSGGITDFSGTHLEDAFKAPEGRREARPDHQGLHFSAQRRKAGRNFVKNGDRNLLERVDRRDEHLTLRWSGIVSGCSCCTAGDDSTGSRNGAGGANRCFL